MMAERITVEAWRADLEAHAASVHSQGGEDGVLLRLFERIGVGQKSFVEFGAWDGLHLSNTANLRLHHGWSGLLMEGSDRADGVLVRRERIDAENVEALFDRYAQIKLAQAGPFDPIATPMFYGPSSLPLHLTRGPRS